LSHEPRGVARGRLQRSHWRKARLDEQCEFVMQTEAWEAEWIHDICPGDDANTGTVHATNQLQRLKEKASSYF
jgi:hypothetical protein